MKRILVVEDEDVIRDFVVINLKRSGYNVVDTSNGESAIKIFDESHGWFYPVQKLEGAVINAWYNNAFC